MPWAIRPPMQSVMASVKQSVMQSLMTWAMPWAWKSQLPYPLPLSPFVPYPYLATRRHVCNGSRAIGAQAAFESGWGL